jgi:hypothetical protein
MSKELTDKELEQKAMKDAMSNYYEAKGITPPAETTTQQAPTPVIPEQISMPSPTKSFDKTQFQNKLSTETDPDLIMTYEVVKLPSEGMFYADGLKEIEIEYLTSRDEDLLTTPSFIEDGTVIDKLLERKIVNKDINPKTLLSGDRSALVLFLRTSSYGNKYKVSVPDPRNNTSFEEEVDLLALKYKENTEKPDAAGEFVVEIPMRKKIVKFRILTSGEDEQILKNSMARQEAYGEEVSEYNTMRLKASMVEISGNRDRSYIERFVDVMPALDAYTIRKRILEVSPDIDMSYEFKAPDGYKFRAPLSMGVDFFFPNL